MATPNRRVCTLNYTDTGRARSPRARDPEAYADVQTPRRRAPRLSRLAAQVCAAQRRTRMARRDSNFGNFGSVSLRERRSADEFFADLVGRRGGMPYETAEDDAPT